MLKFSFNVAIIEHEHKHLLEVIDVSRFSAMTSRHRSGDNRCYHNCHAVGNGPGA